MVFENRVLRRIFENWGRGETTGSYRKLQNEFNNLYFSPNIVTVIILIGMRGVEHVACMAGIINGLTR
jgi:hypothetical protein